MPKNPNNIDTLLTERDDLYLECTEQIFKVYGEKLTQALEFVTNMDRKTEWDIIERYSEHSNIVYALGKVSYHVGDVIPTHSGPKVVKRDGYKGKVRVLITTKVLDECSPLVVYQEIMRLMAYENALSASESFDLFSDSNFYGQLSSDSSTHRLLYDKIKSNVKDGEFNIHELSTAQQVSLKSSEFNIDKKSKRIIH